MVSLTSGFRLLLALCLVSLGLVQSRELRLDSIPTSMASRISPLNQAECILSEKRLRIVCVRANSGLLDGGSGRLHHRLFNEEAFHEGRSVRSSGIARHRLGGDENVLLPGGVEAADRRPGWNLNHLNARAIV